MSITSKEIAKLTGVSVATVSRAINNKPGVSKETRKKIFDMINKVGFLPNFHAKSMKIRKSYTIGMLVADITNPFYAELLKTVEKQARRRNYTVIAGNTMNNVKEEENIISTLQERNVDGYIIASSSKTDSAVKNLINRGFPAIMLYHRTFGKFEEKYVCCDERQGVYKALNHLYELGHKTIAFISASKKYSTSLDRLKAYIDFCEEKNIDQNPYLIKDGASNEKLINKSISELLRLPKKPTAIFATNDFLALHIIDYLLKDGYEIPNDFSIVGFDNIPITEHHSINLTTLDVQAKTGAIIATENLLNEIEGLANSPIRVKLEPKLVIRKSTKNIKKQ